MDLSDLYSGMDRDPDEQQYIVAEMTAILQRDPTNAQAYFVAAMRGRTCTIMNRPGRIWTG
jgi:hypothetical protein